MSLRFIAFSRQINCLRTPWVCQVHNSAKSVEVIENEGDTIEEWPGFGGGALEARTGKKAQEAKNQPGRREASWNRPVQAYIIPCGI
jgi:hypothetical protein